MSNAVIQANYDALDVVARRFGQNAQLVGELRSRLQRSTQALEQGGWQGRGSAAFFGELNGQLLPATQRLRQALDEARAVTLEIRALLQQAEQEAAAPFRSGGGRSADRSSDAVDELTAVVAAVVLPPPSDPQMRDLALKIADARNKLVQRHTEMREDRFGLHKNPTTVQRSIGSWQGHHDQYEGWRNRLIKALHDWWWNGGYHTYPDGLPKDAQQWANTPPPSKPKPAEVLTPTPIAPPMVPPIPTQPPVSPDMVPLPPEQTPTPDMPPTPRTVSEFPAPAPEPLRGPLPPASIPPPTVVFSDSDSSAEAIIRGAGAVVGGAAVGYLIYRTVRFLPSLVPPLWWTIPVNAAVP